MFRKEFYEFLVGFAFFRGCFYSYFEGSVGHCLDQLGFRTFGDDFYSQICRVHNFLNSSMIKIVEDSANIISHSVVDR